MKMRNYKYRSEFCEDILFWKHSIMSIYCYFFGCKYKFIKRTESLYTTHTSSDEYMCKCGSERKVMNYK